MISARKAKHLDVTTMFKYSHANTPLGQSERAFYLGYFIISCFSYIHKGHVGREVIYNSNSPIMNGIRSYLCNSPNVTEGKMILKYRSKSEFLGKKRLRLIRLSLLTNPLLSSDMCFVHVSLLSLVTPNSLELEVHFMSCWLIFKLPKGPIK